MQNAKPLCAVLIAQIGQGYSQFEGDRSSHPPKSVPFWFVSPEKIRREENEERQCDCKWFLKKFIDHSGIRLRFWRAPFHFFIFNFEIFLLWENCRFYNDCIKQLRGNKLVCQCYRIQTKSAVVYKYLRWKKKRKGNWHLSIDFSYKTPSLWHLRLDSKEGTQKGFQAKQFVRFKIRCLTDKTQSGKALQSLSIQSPPTVTHKL